MLVRIVNITITNNYTSKDYRVNFLNHFIFKINQIVSGFKSFLIEARSAGFEAETGKVFVTCTLIKTTFLINGLVIQYSG